MDEDAIFTGKTALITGASSGIGYELTRLFARDGCDLVLVARDAARLTQIAEELRRDFKVSAIAMPKDLAQVTAAEELVRDLQHQGVEVDILVNNAGFNVYGPFWETDARREIQMLQLHVVTLTHLTKLVLPGMVRRRDGRILNMGSTGSFAPGPNDAVYCASKAYVLSFSEALAEELRGTGVTVTALCPGATATAFAAHAQMTDIALFQGRVLTATQVAEAGYRALLRGRRLVVVGLANKLMVVALRFTPRPLVAHLSKRMLRRVGSRSPAAVAAVSVASEQGEGAGAHPARPRRR